MTTAVDLGVLPRGPAAEAAGLAAEAERLGFDGVWVADSQSVFRDAFVTLALAAARTERIRLATAVTNPVTRHPAVLAGAFATLDELSAGRMLVGIGKGESSVHTVGLRPARRPAAGAVRLRARLLPGGRELEGGLGDAGARAP